MALLLSRIGTAGDFLTKTVNSKETKHVINGTEYIIISNEIILIIKDGNALFHAMTNILLTFK